MDYTVQILQAFIQLNNIVCVAVWSLVTHSNCFGNYNYQLVLHGSTTNVYIIILYLALFYKLHHQMGKNMLNL